MSDKHSGCYRDVPMAPVDVVSTVGSWIGREYGEAYRAGLAGTRVVGAGEDRELAYVFQVLASDGSRFLVGCTRWGSPFACKGEAWLAFAQAAQIEAYV